MAEAMSEEQAPAPKKKKKSKGGLVRALAVFVALIISVGAGFGGGVAVGKRLAEMDAEEAAEADAEAAEDEGAATEGAEDSDESADSNDGSETQLEGDSETLGDAVESDGTELPPPPKLSVREELALLRNVNERVIALEVREANAAKTADRLAARSVELAAKQSAWMLSDRVKAAASSIAEMVPEGGGALATASEPEIDEAALAAEAAANERAIADLSKRVQNMKPKKAAAMLTQVDATIAVAVLETLSARNAGKILTAMDAGTSARLAERMASPHSPLTADNNGKTDGEPRPPAGGT